MCVCNRNSSLNMGLKSKTKSGTDFNGLPVLNTNIGTVCAIRLMATRGQQCPFFLHEYR